MKLDRDLMKVMRVGKQQDRIFQKYYGSRSQDRVALLAATALMLVLVLMSGCSLAFGAEIPDDVAVHCILGEARDQGLEGLTAVGEALRNRGTTKGVYGCRANFTEPKWVWNMGYKAWAASKTSNLVRGADHWENVKAFGKPYWADSKTKIVLIGDHQFYK